MKSSQARASKPAPSAAAPPATPKRGRKPPPLAAVALARGEMIAAEAASAMTAPAPRGKGTKAQKPKPATRAGRKGLVLYVKPEVLHSLRRLALDAGSDTQKLGHEALALLFQKYDILLPAGALDAPARG